MTPAGWEEGWRSSAYGVDGRTRQRSPRPLREQNISVVQQEAETAQFQLAIPVDTSIQTYVRHVGIEAMTIFAEMLNHISHYLSRHHGAPSTYFAVAQSLYTRDEGVPFTYDAATNPAADRRRFVMFYPKYELLRDDDLVMPRWLMVVFDKDTMEASYANLDGHRVVDHEFWDPADDEDDGEDYDWDDGYIDGDVDVRKVRKAVWNEVHDDPWFEGWKDAQGKGPLLSCFYDHTHHEVERTGFAVLELALGGLLERCSRGIDPVQGGVCIPFEINGMDDFWPALVDHVSVSGISSVFNTWITTYLNRLRLTIPGREC